MAPGLVESSAIPSDLIESFKVDKHSTLSNYEDMYGHYHPADPASLSLESNFGPMDPESVGFLQPTSADAPLEVLHDRFQRDSYLFVSNPNLAQVPHPHGSLPFG